MGQMILSILWFIGLFVFFFTGELVLFVITFGRHSIKTSIDKADSEGKYAKGQVLFEASYYFGIAFWILVIIAINKYIL